MSWHISGGYLISLICLRRSLMPRSYCESLHVTCGPVPLSTSSGSRQLSQGNSSCWHPKRPPPCDWRPHQGPPRTNEKQKWDKGMSCRVLVFQIQNTEIKMRITSDKVHYHQNQLRQLSKKSAWGWSLRFQHTSLKDIFQVGSEKIMRWLGRWLGLHQFLTSIPFRWSSRTRVLNSTSGVSSTKKIQASPRLSEKKTCSREKSSGKETKSLEVKPFSKVFEVPAMAAHGLDVEATAKRCMGAL